MLRASMCFFSLSKAIFMLLYGICSDASDMC
uniref:Uncharacterized protein n=1 Tax=Arundo donax TaxID=35708 RepID=A0A0A9FQX2_ARUDO